MIKPRYLFERARPGVFGATFVHPDGTRTTTKTIGETVAVVGTMTLVTTVVGFVLKGLFGENR